MSYQGGKDRSVPFHISTATSMFTLVTSTPALVIASVEDTLKVASTKSKRRMSTRLPEQVQQAVESVLAQGMRASASVQMR